MKWLFFLFSMNLFLTYYPVKVVSCNQIIEVEYQEKKQILELFNVESLNQNRVCELLLAASEVHIAFEPNIQQDANLSAWVFVDGMLLQQILVEEENAIIIRKNPTYQYQLQEQKQMVSIPFYEPIVMNQTRGTMIVIAHFVISLLLVIMCHWAKY